MGYLIGTDEAGYGPNLGPLVISATVWEAPDGVGGEDLFGRLGHVIAERIADVSDNGGPRVAMADSKKLYTPDKGLRHLERGLWAALGLCGHRPGQWRDAWHALAPEAVRRLPAAPWYADYNEPAPVDVGVEEIAPLADALQTGLAAAGVRLVAVQSRVIFADEFNDLLDRYGSKGIGLSYETLALAARMIEPLPASPISVICDKHGGRNRYGPLLSRYFPDWVIEIHGEARERSVYRFGPAERRVEFCFRTKAESCLPAALASMASKYLRELAMRAFNDYWGQRVPGLRPTAGYPEDAKRFRADIAETQARLHISDRVLWRKK